MRMAVIIGALILAAGCLAGCIACSLSRFPDPAIGLGLGMGVLTILAAVVALWEKL